MSPTAPQLNSLLRERTVKPRARIGHTGEHRWFAAKPRLSVPELELPRGRAIPVATDLMATLGSVGGAAAYAALMAATILAAGTVAVTTVYNAPDHSVDVALSTPHGSHSTADLGEPQVAFGLTAAQPERGEYERYAVGSGTGQVTSNIFDAHMGEIGLLAERHGGATGRVELAITLERGRVRSVTVLPSTTAPSAFVDDLVRRVRRWNHGNTSGTARPVLVLR